MGDIVLGLFSEVQHGLIGRLPLNRVAQCCIVRSVVGIERNGEGVDPALQLRDHIPAMDQVGMAIGVDAYRGQLPAEAFFQLVHQPEDVLNTVGRLSIAAEHNLPIRTHIPAEKAVQSLLSGGLPLQPE